MKQEYPSFIYHVIHDAKIIKTDDEWIEHEKNGWTKDYQSFSAEQEIEKKLIYHKSEIERLKKLLHNYHYEIETTTANREEVKPKVVEETPSVVENEQPAEDPKPKRRGRPKREV